MIWISCKRLQRWNCLAIVSAILFISDVSLANKEGYYGKFIGKLSQLHHGVSGEVYAVDARTLHLRNFNYDGEGPAAYFYAGNSKAPSSSGFRLRDERGTTNVLPRYVNKHITITLPEGKTLQNIRWFSVWCDEFAVNFGDVRISKNLDFPRPQKIGALNGVHGVSSDQIVIVDAQTLLIPNFSYDGEAPDAKFWVGRGPKPSPQGIRVPDENGKELPLRRYDRKTIVLTLPGDLTVFEIGHFGVWCEAFTVDFGHVQLPRGVNVPPSLKMLGVSPQSKLNCEVLWDDLAFEVRWAVAGDSIVLQLVAKLEPGEYMAFGLSGDSSRSKMVGGDVTVAWVDKETLKGHAYDYYLDAKSQCSGGRGSCPDDNIIEKTNSVRLLNAALVNGYSIVTFQRSLRAQDELDKPVYINGTQPIIWAIGPLNARKEVSYHSLANRGDILVDFGRPPKWNCPTPETSVDGTEPEKSSSNTNHKHEIAATVEKVTDIRQQTNNRREPSRPKPVPTPAPVPKSGNAWEIPAIQCHEPEDGVFYAQMGPTGGKRGYSAITGHVGWGISWYINGLLIPEINVVRGRTYTFIVEGGLDPETPARYHPFYITDDPVGGYAHKTPEERANIQIFAGAVQNKRGEVRPTGVGRLCNWTPDPKQPPADEFSSFGAYQRTLKLECDQGEPGIIQWTVDKDTPDTVYYQCYTHRYLGWKINVVDDCETEASEPIPSVVKAPTHLTDKISHEEDSVAHHSINHATKIKPDSKYKTNRLKNKPEKNVLKGNQNEFTKVKYVPEFTYYNEETGEPISAETVAKIKSQDEIKDLQKQYAMQDPLIQQQIMDQLNNQPQKVPQHQLPQYQPLEPQLTVIPQPSIQQTFAVQPEIPVHHLHHHHQHLEHQQPQGYANVPVQLPQFKSDEQFIKFFHPPNGPAVPQLTPLQIQPQPLSPVSVPVSPIQHIQPVAAQTQGLSMYSVNEQHEEPSLQNHRHNYQVVHMPTHSVQTRKPEPDLMTALQNFHIKADTIPINEPQPVQFDPVAFSARLPDEFKVDEKFNEEFLKNYHLLKAQAEENLKKHKHKLQQYNKATNRLPNAQPLGSSTRLQYNSIRKPAPHHALTLQQRPLPPGMFRPPFLPPPVNKQQQQQQQFKRPQINQAASQKVPTYLHPNNIPQRQTRPQKPHRQSNHKLHQIKLQQYLALQKQLESLTTFKPEFDTSALLTSSPVIVDKTTENPPPLAINTGFNPESVKVEGGFKPIISTGIAPKLDAIDRMDENVGEEETDDDDDKIGVIDLRQEDNLGEKSALFKDTKEELIKVENKNTTEDQNATASESVTQKVEAVEDEKKIDLFKNQKPQMFEPMFIPSPPDHRITKYQEKHKKKPVMKYNEMNLKYRNHQMQHYNTQKNNNYYVKIRPRPNLIRRPLYPNNMVPPFKIPERGGYPQFRYQQSEESVEDTTDFEIIKMNNDSVNTDDDTAENILEVLEMEEGNTVEPNIEENTENELINTTEDEIAMADEQKDFYLPPRAGVVTTYDGKIVKAAPAPSLPTKKSSIDISKLPQFGPYRGEAPPLSPQTVSTENLPQLKSRPASLDILPPRGFPNPPSIQSTKLSLIRNYDYEPQSSEIKETVEVKNESSIGEIEHGEEKRSRAKRSPDHVPGHVGPNHDDHDDHDDHSHHHHDHSSNNSNYLLPSFFLLSLICVQRFL